MSTALHVAAQADGPSPRWTRAIDTTLRILKAVIVAMRWLRGIPFQVEDPPDQRSSDDDVQSD